MKKINKDEMAIWLPFLLNMCLWAACVILLIVKSL